MIPIGPTAPQAAKPVAKSDTAYPAAGAPAASTVGAPAGMQNIPAQRMASTSVLTLVIGSPLKRRSWAARIVIDGNEYARLRRQRQIVHGPPWWVFGARSEEPPGRSLSSRAAHG